MTLKENFDRDYIALQLLIHLNARPDSAYKLADEFLQERERQKSKKDIEIEYTPVNQ